MPTGPTNAERVLTLLLVVLIIKVTFSVMLGYRDYFPPNFDSNFLDGRQSYFFGVYHLAFYTHIITGPLSLIVGLVLISQRFRMRFPKWHRSLGRIQAAIVLFLLAPSGLWMAYHAETGAVAATGFSLLAVVTGMCVLFGSLAAVKKRFGEHRRWMLRCFLLLCSAVVLRLFGGLGAVAGVASDWSYPLAAWASWLLPLTAFEVTVAIRARLRHSGIVNEAHSVGSPGALSLPAIEITAK